MDEPLALGVAAPARPHARWVVRGVGAALVLTGAVLAAVELGRVGAWGPMLARLGLGSFGWGPLVGAVKGVLEARRTAAPSPAVWLLGPAAAAWLVGWALVALGGVRKTGSEPARAEQTGSGLWSPLAGWRDFHLGTLAAYGVGILGAELVLVLLQTALASASRGVGWGPPAAFGVALTAAAAVAFLGGFVGAARARKLSAPRRPSPSSTSAFRSRCCSRCSSRSRRSTQPWGRGSGRSSTWPTCSGGPSSGTG
jgi:lipoprotein-releasing system permease protein